MTGWTWEQVRQEMTIPRIKAMQRQWVQQPPMHILVAGYLGYKPDAETGVPAPAKEEKPQDLSELIELFGAAGGNIKHG